MSSEDLKKALLPVFRKYKDEVIAAYLFGSAAKDKAASSSDIDIALLLGGRQRESFMDLRFRLYADFCRALKRNDIDLVLLNLSGNLILQDEIVRNGVVLYDGNPELRIEFESKILHDSIDFKNQRLQVIGV